MKFCHTHGTTLRGSVLDLPRMGRLAPAAFASTSTDDDGACQCYMEPGGAGYASCADTHFEGKYIKARLQPLTHRAFLREAHVFLLVLV